jgi:uroporphyrinogen III methyltransferase/synthase
MTGHEDPSKPETGLDLDRIAAIPGTKVILMGVERIGEIAQSLIKHGMPPETPVAMMRWSTTGRQQSIQGTLATIGEVVAEKKFKPPAVTVIGEVVKLREKLNWFEHRSLFGQRIIVTRTRDQASQLSGRLLELGADVLEVPTIKLAPPDAHQNIVDAILGLNSYDWIVFTSPNGVSSFFDLFFKTFDDLRDIGGVRLAAVGPATAAKLREIHLKVEVMPGDYLAKNIASAIAAFESLDNLRILLARAQVADPELPQTLEAMGAIVDDVACYKTVPETEDLNGDAARMLESGADWVTLTSASTVENFHARFNLPDLLQRFPKTKLASIGPETTKAIAALGLHPVVEAKEHTIPGLVRALEAHVREK